MKKAKRKVGRPKERPTIVRGFRLDKEHYEKAMDKHGSGVVNEKIKNLFKRLS